MLGTGLGTFYGIRKSNSLVEYRLHELEKRVEIHNNLVERMTLAEHNIKGMTTTIERFQDRVSAHGEQIDQVYTLVEKNEGRINLLEKGFLSRGSKA